MKQKIRSFLAVAFSACLLSACDKPNSSTEVPQSAVEKNNVSINRPLNVVAPWEITSVDPSKSGYIFQRLQLAETLIDADDKGNLLPALATSWQSNDSADEWILTLRENVKFHDGTILNADNVVQSLTVALAKPGPLKSILIKKITALSPTQVQISLEKPLVSLPAYLAHATTIILAKSAFDAENNVIAIVGTGAYKADKIEPPQKIEQTAFVDYWGEKAKISQVTYLANSRSETRTLLAQSNPNYLVFNLDPASLAKLKQDPNLILSSKSIARTIQYKVNAKHPLFENIEVRQALSDAIDRAGIAQSVLRIEKGIAEQIVPEAFSDWRVHAEYKQPDSVAIKARLIALGFVEDTQGMLHKD
ncbi:MAG: ABC transporter substrate-binding protein [Lonepinella koalarum]|nr:ABC transporter substrate-binding protein [Lonepinella koalarum]